MPLLGHVPAAMRKINCVCLSSVCLSVCVGKLVYALQVSFLAYAFGGGVGHQLNFQPKYQGRDLAFMHSHMVEKGLTMDHFDAVLRHFCQTLRQLNMPQVGFCCLVVSSASW